MGTVRPLPRRLNSAYRHGAEKRRWTERKIGKGSGVGRRGGGGRPALWKFGRFATFGVFSRGVLGVWERRMIGLRWFEAHDCRRPAAAGQRDAFCREITRRGRRLGRVGGTGDKR